MNAVNKILDIHEILSHGATFLKIREFFNELEKKEDNISAMTLLECLSKVHATCVFIHNMENKE